MSSTDTETTAAAPEPEAEAAPVDEIRAALLAKIADLLGDDLVESHIAVGRELVIRVRLEAWKSVHKTMRDDLGFKFFEFLSAIDWMPSPFGKTEDASADTGMPVTLLAEPGAIETGYAGGDTRFQVFSRLVDITNRSLGVTIKADVEDPRDASFVEVASIIGIFPGANWHERETHEMFGIRFADHPYLEKLYLPTGFEGNPLRKDFPLLARHVKPWPGIVDVEPMPAGDDDDAESSEGDES